MRSNVRRRSLFHTVRSCSLLFRKADTEITLLSAGSQRRRSFKFQTGNMAVGIFVIDAEDLCQFRHLQFSEQCMIRTSDDIHAVFALLLGIEDILKARFRSEELF